MYSLLVSSDDYIHTVRDLFLIAIVLLMIVRLTHPCTHLKVSHDVKGKGKKKKKIEKCLLCYCFCIDVSIINPKTAKV